MNDKLKKFEEKVQNSEDAAIVDLLIEYVKKMHDDMNYYESVTILKVEIMNRLRKNENSR